MSKFSKNNIVKIPFLAMENISTPTIFIRNILNENYIFSEIIDGKISKEKKEINIKQLDEVATVGSTSSTSVQPIYTPIRKKSYDIDMFENCVSNNVSCNCTINGVDYTFNINNNIPTFYENNFQLDLHTTEDILNYLKNKIKSTVNESVYKNTTPGKDIYYTYSESEAKQIINTLLPQFPIRGMYDFNKKIYMFGNANNIIHVEFIEEMRWCKEKLLYPSDEQEMYAYMDKYCSMFKIIDKDELKSFTRNDGYRYAYIGKINDNSFVIFRNNEFVFSVLNAPDELKKIQRVPLFKNIEFKKYDVRDKLNYENKPQNLFNEGFETGGVNWSFDSNALGSVPSIKNCHLFFVMFPNEFLNLCPKFSYGDSKFFDKYLQSRNPLGIPFLNVEIDYKTKTLKVNDHDGRHRVDSIMRTGKNPDIPVAIFYNKKYSIPYIDDLKKNWKILSQDGSTTYNIGQFSVYNSLPQPTNHIKSIQLYKDKKMNEEIFYATQWKDDFNEDILFTVLKNPTKKEFWNLFNESKEKQLRGILGVNESSNLYVWDSYYGTHDDVYQHHIIGKDKDIDKAYCQIYFNKNDIKVFGYSKELNNVEEKYYDKILSKPVDDKLWNELYNDESELLDETIAYAGSIKDYDKPSLKAIGSGEGHQAHGWGLYYALNKDVAQGYRDRFVKYNTKLKVGDDVYNSNSAEAAIFRSFEDGWTIEDLIDYTKTVLKGTSSKSDYHQEAQQQYDFLMKHADDLKNVKFTGGQLVKVMIPDNIDLLNEQNMLIDQPPKVEKAIWAINDKLNLGIKDSGIRGYEIYELISNKLGSDKKASMFLLKYGIKGISYDGRKDGSCFVIFNPKDVQILEKYYSLNEMRVYAGSPIEYDKPSLKAIGSGEGYQAHGWGLYYTIDRKIANKYANSFSIRYKTYYKGKLLTIDNKKVYLDGKEASDNQSLYDMIYMLQYMTKHNYAEELKKQNIESEKALKVITNPEYIKRNKNLFNKNKVRLEILNNIEQKESFIYVCDIPETGYIYEDRNLIEQPQSIKNILLNIKDKFNLQNNDSGKDIYYKISTKLGSDKKASMFLLKQGIKGITYYGDQDGRCFVVFNPKDVQIIETRKGKLNESTENTDSWFEGLKPIKVENVNEYDFTQNKTRIFEVYHGTRHKNITSFTSPYSDGLIFFAFDYDMAHDWGKNAYNSTDIETIKRNIDKMKYEYQKEVSKQYAKDYGNKWYEDESIYDSARYEVEQYVNKLEKEYGIDNNVMTIYVKTHKIFDPTKHYSLVLDEIQYYYSFSDEELIKNLDRIKKGSWVYFEHKNVVDKIYELGFDAIVLREHTDGDITTLAVRNLENNIKIV